FYIPLQQQNLIEVPYSKFRRKDIHSNKNCFLHTPPPQPTSSPFLPITLWQRIIKRILLPPGRDHNDPSSSFRLPSSHKFRRTSRRGKQSCNPENLPAGKNNVSIISKVSCVPTCGSFNAVFFSLNPGAVSSPLLHIFL
ncbi:MAG: hypothetical protein WBQ32_14030, partial [Ignavibacteriaceae bacterium]